jgi:ribosomal protein S9
MAMTLKIDQLAREIFARASIAVSQKDATQALAVCRDLVQVERDYRLALRTADFATDAARAEPDEHEMRARFAGRCAACSRAISVGDVILYDTDAKRATHVECRRVNQ